MSEKKNGKDNLVDRNYNLIFDEISGFTKLIKNQENESVDNIGGKY